MVRKDSEKDSERPHYYSQFWLDVAAGRRIIGAPKPNEEGESADEASEPAPQRRGRLEDILSDDDEDDTIVHPVAEPLTSSSENYLQPDADNYASTSSVESQSDESEVADSDIPDMDFDSYEEGEEDDEYYEDEEEDGEEDGDLDWSRSRKRSKSVRPTKPVRKPGGRRDIRRGF
ncbi:MAG TPA: hypothetical protein VL461_06655 [Dictyobacter sp.]|jgi:hypothetical protein|nr:hypothetical protein [Dictyobacter sp.]